jgi:hypothetical protein
MGGPMKRVLLLALLVVSLVEVALDRDRMYVLFLVVALAGLVHTSFTNRRRVQNAISLRASTPKDEIREGTAACSSTKQGDASYPSSPHVSEDHYEKGVHSPVCLHH